MSLPVTPIGMRWRIFLARRGGGPKRLVPELADAGLKSARVHCISARALL